MKRIPQNRIFLFSACILILFTVLFLLGALYPGARELSEEEKELAQFVYGDAVDLSKVHIVFHSWYARDASKTIGNTVHMKYPEAKLATYETTLIHELAHVWQYQQHGWGYIPKSLTAQLLAFLRTGSRNSAYNWEERIAEGASWEEMNPEEQAEAVTAYFQYSKLQGKEGERDKLACLIPFLSCEGS
ncbi:MAG: hypothetical protein Q8Q38_00350 [bacterium]|nr:hypothetical protein [bacterium]